MANDKTTSVFSILGVFALIFSLVALTNSTTNYNDLENKPDYSDYWNTLNYLDLVDSLNDNLVLWLPLNDGVDNASDYSGFMNHGVIYGASWVDGKYGKALSFNGSTDYINVLHDDTLSIFDEITILMWVYIPTDGDIPHSGFVNKGDESSGLGNAYMLWYNTNPNQLQFKICIGSSAYTSGSNNFVRGAWQQIGGWYDGNNVKVILNGVFDGTTYPSASGAINTVSDDVHIGRGYSGKYVNGTIDEVRIYNRALNVDEISVLYNLP